MPSSNQDIRDPAALSREAAIPIPVFRSRIDSQSGAYFEQYRDTPDCRFDLPPINRHWIICQDFTGPERLRVTLNETSRAADQLCTDRIIYIPPGTTSSWDFSAAAGSTHFLVSDHLLIAALPKPSDIIELYDQGPLVGASLPEVAQRLRACGDQLCKTEQLAESDVIPIIADATSSLANGLLKCAKQSTKVDRKSSGRSKFDKCQLRNLRRFMWEQLQENLSIEDLAEQVHLSRFHFSRVFKSLCGRTPYQELLQLRVLKARTLLSSGETLTDVAYHCGFADQAHFTRIFKAHTAFPPSHFRKTHL